MPRDIKKYYCKVCKCNIKEAKCVPVIDGEDIVCSDCCKMAIFYHLGYVKEEQFKLLPNYIKKYCIKYHLRKLKEENPEFIDEKIFEELSNKLKEINMIEK